MHFASHYSEILEKAIGRSSLLITARGIGVEHVVCHLCRGYQDARHFLVVLGLSDEERILHCVAKYIREEDSKALVHVITSTSSIRDRVDMYLKGGIFVLYSAKPILMDILHERISPLRVQGIVMLRAHSLVNADSGSELFLLHYLRQISGNRVFFCALSETPEAFIGPGRLAQIMSSVLHCSEVYLYPRFHVSLKKSLEKKPILFTEVRVSMPPAMRAVQTTLLSMITELIHDLRTRTSSSGCLNNEELSIEHAVSGVLFRSCRKAMNASRGRAKSMKGIWSSAMYSLLESLEDIVSLLHKLYLLPPPLFQRYCENFLSIARQDGVHVASWLHCKQAHRLIPAAHDWKRAYEQNQQKEEDDGTVAKRLKTSKDEDPSQDRFQGDFVSKEHAVLSILRKLERQGRHSLVVLSGWSGTSPMVSSSVQDGNMEGDYDGDWSPAYALQKFTSSSACYGVCRELPLTFGWRQHNKHIFYDIAEYADTNLLSVNKSSLLENNKKGISSSSLSSQNKNLALVDSIILCGIDLATVRRLEVAQALAPAMELHVFAVSYDGSIEQMLYLHAVKSEREAFQELVASKSNLVLPSVDIPASCGTKELTTITLDGMVDTSSEFTEKTPTEQEAVGADDDTQPQKYSSTQDVTNSNTSPSEKKSSAFLGSGIIIVDEREFRSNLPYHLCRTTNFKVIPRTLKCGDYLLSGDIAVERKSAVDLETSLFSGRLYDQLVEMSKSYSACVLLIEAAASSADRWYSGFQKETLPGKHPGMTQDRVVSALLRDEKMIDRLALLAVRFPTLRVFWTLGGADSARLFQAIKKGLPEPAIPEDKGIVINEATSTAAKQVAGRVLSLKSVDDSDAESPSSTSALELLMKLPGVSRTNVSGIVRHFPTLRHLARASKTDLCASVSQSDAIILYEALHTTGDVNEKD